MECLRPVYVSKVDMLVPCGRCEFCTVTKRSDWATRIYYESKLHVGSKFVTLTYANNALTWDHGNPQLVKADLQRWFKRVRKAGYKFRYFAVGEYGSQTYRPHYHVLVFGDVPEKVLKDAWHDGMVHVGTVTQASIMYCLGYVVGGKHWKMCHHRVKPFAIMSRRPGIGANYLSKDMVAWHKSGRKNYVLVDGLKKHLPRFYKTKIFSKIDLVRIAVRDQKEVFKRKVEWLRSPKMSRMKDPLGYLAEQNRRAVKRIRGSLKENLV